MSPPPPPNSQPLYHYTLIMLQDYFKINLEFLKLEKIQFGGSKGKCLVEMVAQIYAEFTELIKIFTSSSYDPMVLTAKVGRQLQEFFGRGA